MRYTLLELVQRILESMESDEVSGISETPESTAVANIIKECYFNIIGPNIAEEKSLFRLDASTDSSQPCMMTLPETVSQVEWLQYNRSEDLSKPVFQWLDYISLDRFLYQQGGIDPADPASGSQTVNGFVFRYKTDAMPRVYTILQDYWFIFDSYQSDYEDTLTSVNSLAYGPLVPSFSMTNSFVPNLDPREFQLLLNEAKAQAFIELKQMPNTKAEQKSRKNEIFLQKIKYDNDPNWQTQGHARFGRRGFFYPMRRPMREGV